MLGRVEIKVLHLTMPIVGGLVARDLSASELHRFTASPTLNPALHGATAVLAYYFLVRIL